MRPLATTGVEDYLYNSGKTGGAAPCGAPCALPSICCGAPGPKYHPQIITHTQEEHKWMLADLLTQREVAMKTVILPPGMSMDNPALLNAKVLSRKAYWLEPGKLPELPLLPLVTDVDAVLVPPCEGVAAGRMTRYQVIPESVLPESERDARCLVAAGDLKPEEPSEPASFLVEMEEHKKAGGASILLSARAQRKQEILVSHKIRLA